MPETRLLPRFRRPEYTGENRCMPCTIVNALITAVLAVSVVAGSRVADVDILTSILLGGVIVSVGGASIYLRGYLVPGTPWLTRRYFPDSVLQYFDKVPADGGAELDTLDREELLLDAGVVTECETVDDLCLTDDFRQAWHAEMDERQDTSASIGDLATMVGADSDALEVETHDDALFATYDGRHIGQWESDAAFIADMSAAAILSDRIPYWDDIDSIQRSRLLGGLRAFLEACPVCGGTIEIGESEVTSCCRTIDVVAVECTSCGRRLLEAEHPG